ncbi:AfsR/SARP family transcriptional regulator [Actinomadura alba]|uniref:Uncharacterized protein n=1 Tax=Actinomadura alba TaxID=406431 RepID=A0ABR7M122_9ACTN|nr:BTAD domain-containing putative transcriptional regulator [Actinomadura alba]MBC6470700.1 hypothetical protein [Actinomadura alba]
MNEPRLRFGVLGPLVAEKHGRPIDLPRSKIMRGLLGVLLLAQPQALSAERMLDLVWSARGSRTGRGTVQVGISRLREWLTEFTAGEPGLISVDHDASGYRLSVDPLAVDMSRFRLLTAEAEGAAPAERRRLLERAVELSRGPVLADLPHLALGDRLLRSAHEEVRATFLAFAETALAEGRPHEALGPLDAMAAAAPLDEPVHAWLLKLLAACERPAEALARYESLRTRLTENLGVSPSTEVQQAHLAILARDREIIVATPSAPCLLPPDIVDFVGRGEQVERLVKLLAGDGRSMATALVVGEGGIGKTTLVTHVAHRVRTAFPDGQMYVDLQGAEALPADPGEVLGRFLTALGVDGRALPKSVAERAERLRSLVADRRVLMVLDNAADERQIRPLLPGGSGCAVLVNGRRRLPGLSAHTMQLTAFDAETALALLRRMIGHKRVLSEPDAAREIVDLCGGLPLAVRIAGARLAARERWSLAHLADRLRLERRRLDELSAGDLTVRASLTMSYRTLDAPARRAFRLLGLLDVPDFPVWVCAALLDIATDEAEALLDALMDALLLVCVGTDACGNFRYRFHDLVRLYARERAEAEDGSAECAAAVGRALGAWLALAEAADRGLPERVAADIDGPARRRPPYPPIEPVATADCLNWFDSERAALAACVAQAAAAGFTDLAWELAARSLSYYAFRGLYEDWSHTHEVARRACMLAGDRLGEAVMVRNLSCLRMTGVKAGPGTVPARIAAALRTFRESGLRHGEVDMLGMFVFSLRGGRPLDDVLAMADAAMDKAEGIGYELGQTRLWYMRALAHREQGRYPDAIRCAERCLDMAADAGTAHDRVLALWEMAAACHGETDSARISERVREGIDVCRRRGERLLEAYLLLSHGELHLQAGRLTSARAQTEKALAVFDEHVILFGRGAAHRLLGRLHHVENRPALAVPHFIRAERAFLRLRNTLEQAMTLKAMAESMYANGQHTAAERTRRRAHTLFVRIGNGTEAAAVRGLGAL